MNYKRISKPIGLNIPCKEIENICNKAELYKRCGLSLPNFIIPLDSGNGRTTFIQYMVDMYKEYSLLNFNSGLDDYIEISFDGSLPQLKNSFARLKSAAVYTNEYCGIVGMDITSLSFHLGETQITEFLINTKRICADSCLVFFVNNTTSKNEEKLLEKLSENIGNIKRLEVKPYTAEEISKIIGKFLNEYGVFVSDNSTLNSDLVCLISECEINTIKDAKLIAQKILLLSKSLGSIPIVKKEELKLMINGK